MERTVLVLGSKPDAFIPDINPIAIVSANGAAERAKLYLEKHPYAIPLISIVSSDMNFSGNDVFYRVLSANPVQLIARRQKLTGLHNVIENKLDHQDSANTIKLVQMTEKAQWDFQADLLGLKNLLYAELGYQNRFSGKLKRFRQFKSNGSLLGASTGLFAGLYASSMFSDCKILLAGIGVESGGHFYEKTSHGNHGKRALVDYRIWKTMPADLKRRFLTTDLSLSKVALMEHLDIYR